MDKGLMDRLTAAFLTLTGLRPRASEEAAPAARDPSGEGAPEMEGIAVLHRERSAFNDISVEEEPSGVRSLVFAPGMAVQSSVLPGRPLELRLAYTRVAMAALAFRSDIRRVLVVGLGGGAMPMFLRCALPEAVIDVAEQDAAVVWIAREFMGLRPDGQLRVHVGDGREFIAAPGPAYDVIFLDAYGSASIPRHLASVEFLREVRARLSGRGLTAANIWSPSFNGMYAAMHRTYCEVFGPSLLVLDAEGSGNRLFFAEKSGAPLDTGAAADRASALVRRLHLPFDLAGAIRAGGIEENWPEAVPIRDRE